MRISARAEYACLAVIELARTGSDGGPRRVKDIASAQGIPERYLVQILLQLKAVGLVHSARGSVGGYLLARPPESISVAEVITAIDGRGEKLGRGEKISASSRQLADLLERARSAQQAVLASVSIAQLAVEPTSPVEWVV